MALASCWRVGLVCMGMASVTAAAAPAYDAVVLVYDGHGTRSGFDVSGRVLKDRHIAAGRADDPAAMNAWRMISDLESDELPGVDVAVAVAGSIYTATTDVDGIFRVRVRGLPVPLPIGPLVVQVTLHANAAHAPVGVGTIHVGPVGGVGLVSDIDDTVIKTWVTDKRRMAREVLLTNAEQLEPVAGAAAAYRQARAHGVDAVFYISSSPQNLYTRLKRALEKNGYPPGPLFLKNLGTDALAAHDDYKLGRLEQLMSGHPGMRFVLVGDSGERDPEIYRAFRLRHPDRVIGIVIRMVPGTVATSPPRFAGMTVVDDAYASDDVISRLLTPSPP